jgi:hypothetical protein
MHLVTFSYGVNLLTERWLGEGIARLGSMMCDFSIEDETILDLQNQEIATFIQKPSLSLMQENNGVAGLFFRYIQQRYGIEAIKAILSKSTNAEQRISTALGKDFAEVFREWGIANYTGGYTIPDLKGQQQPIKVIPSEVIQQYNGQKTKIGSADTEGDLQNWSTEYLVLEKPLIDTVFLEFDGDENSQFQITVFSVSKQGILISEMPLGSKNKAVFSHILTGNIVIMVQQLGVSTDSSYTINLSGKREHPYDVDRSGVVDVADLVLVGKQFGQQIEVPENCDVNNDGIIDLSDIALVGKHFSERYTR